MSDVFLPFARRTEDGLIVAVADVLRGAACGCVCPGCGHPVVARQGTERQWSFAHVKGIACEGAYEKSIHAFAQQTLAHGSDLLLPALTVTAQAFDRFGRTRTESVAIRGSRTVAILRCALHREVEDVTPDATVLTDEGPIHVEIVVVHRLSDDKRERLVKTGVPCMAINLAALYGHAIDEERIAAALFQQESNREWVFHPDMAPALSEAQTRLRAVLDLERPATGEGARSAALSPFAARKAPLAVHGAQSASVAQPGELTWRASLPSRDSIETAALTLSRNSTIPVDVILTVVGSVKLRADLVNTSPFAQAEKWAAEIGISSEQVRQFLIAAGFAL